MAFFGNNKNDELEALQARFTETAKKYKRLAALLAEERKKTEALTAQVATAELKVKKMEANLAEAKKRQKASRERANRFKNRTELLNTI